MNNGEMYHFLQFTDIKKKDIYFKKTWLEGRF
jgi:hypothetical protein